MADPLDSKEGLITEARYVWNIVEGNPTAYQITAAQATMLDTLTKAAETTLAARTATENKLATDRAAFKGAFNALETFFRPLRQSIDKNPATTDEQRAELHLTGGEGESEPGDPLAAAPLLFVEQAGSLVHLIRFFMPGEDSNSTKKPKGVHGCKIYLKIGGAPPASLKECALITTDTKSPYSYTHEPEEAGKTAHYIGVWVDADDDPSPKSETFSITITG